MKKQISILATVIVALPLNTVGATALKPSLSVQMAQQEVVNRKATNIQIFQTLKEKRLAQIAINQSRKPLTLISSPKTLVAATVTPTAPVSKATPVTTPLPEKQAETPTRVSAPVLSPVPAPQNIDMQRVRDTWMGWYNDVRDDLGLGDYSYDARLESTAYDWNRVFSASRGSNHHTRSAGDGYYNFSVIDQWFKARGIDPVVRNRAKHVENVGYGYYRCNESDCTDELISSIRSTFNFFMSEKGKAYDAHYKSIVNPNFSKIGFNVITVPSESRYYITVHYITE